MLASTCDSITDADVFRFSKADARADSDLVAVEEPLEIQMRGPRDAHFRPLSITMRTPGNDRELAAGFMFNEGIVQRSAEIANVEPWGPLAEDIKVHNTLRITLAKQSPNSERLERHFYTNSACGVCGRRSVHGLRLSAAPLPANGARVPASTILNLPRELRSCQEAFDSTGGLHATALFTCEGVLLRVFEDVGRHNAMDKLAGALLFADSMPGSDGLILAVSGRLSFELVQKAVMMRIPVLCGIGAPSSLAIDIARRANLTLVGFMRDSRFNVYTHEFRVRVGQ